MPNFEDKNTVVAGGSSGVGRSLVHHKKNGAIAHVVSRNKPEDWPTDILHLCLNNTKSWV